MKNDNLPLVKALQNRGKKGTPANVLPIQAPRTFELKHDEITGLPGRKVGDSISVHLHGHIQSQHNEGHAVMHVSSVKPDTNAAEGYASK